MIVTDLVEAEVKMLLQTLFFFFSHPFTLLYLAIEDADVRVLLCPSLMDGAQSGLFLS